MPRRTPSDRSEVRSPVRTKAPRRSGSPGHQEAWPHSQSRSPHHRRPHGHCPRCGLAIRSYRDRRRVPAGQETTAVWSRSSSLPTLDGSMPAARFQFYFRTSMVLDLASASSSSLSRMSLSRRPLEPSERFSTSRPSMSGQPSIWPAATGLSMPIAPRPFASPRTSPVIASTSRGCVVDSRPSSTCSLPER
jgi:hypothetical protein